MPSVAGSSWDDLAQALQQLRASAGNPSFGVLAGRVGQLREQRGERWSRPGRSTVYDAFQLGRRRLDVDLVLDLVAAMGGTADDAAAWLERCETVLRSTSSTAVARAEVAAPSPTFTGRAALVDEIVAASSGRDAVRTWALTGIGGVGKTQLALTLAERLVARGVVDRAATVDLRGYDPSVTPAGPRAALESLLAVFGAPVPRRLEARRDALVEALRRERWVLVVENARDDADLHLLTGADTSSVVLVTSRERLEHLDAREVAVGPVDDGEAVELLLAELRAGGSDVPVDVAAALAATAGGLPLALTLLAGRVAGRPGWTPADHLEHQRERRELLRLDEPLARAVGATYDRLDDPSRQLLRRLATQPCRDLDLDAAVALSGRDRDTATAALAALVLHRVVDETTQGAGARYGLHDVVRLFAVEAAHRQERPGERAEALDRLVDHHLARLWGVRPHLPEVLASVQPPPDVAVDPMDAGSAHAWLLANLDNLLQLVHTSRRDEYVGQVSGLVSERLVQLGRLGDLLRLADQELAAGERRGDDTAVARARFRQGNALVWQGNPRSAERLLLAAREGLSHDPEWEAPVLNSLGLASFYAGHLTASLAIFQELTGPEVHANMRQSGLWNSALLLNDLGRYAEADEVIAEAVALTQDLADAPTATWLHANVAEALVGRGEHEAALARADLALAVAGGEEAHLSRLHARVVRCTALAGLGRHDEAAGDLTTLLGQARAGGNRQMERTVRTLLGRTALGQGALTEATRHAEAALALADDLGAPLGRADTEVVLGDIDAACGDLVRARARWTEAERAYADAGAVVVHEVRERLARVTAAG